MKIEILPRAIQDLELASDFYESQTDSLGQRFMVSLLSDIDYLAEIAGVHSKQFGFHRKISKRFPFAIYYKMSGDAVRVYAVLDCRQNPSEVGNRLQQERDSG